MEFTPEQQAHIDNLIEESKKGLFTEDELTRRVTSEVDRRVESGIQKGLETQKAKWEKEFRENAELSAEELAQRKIDETLRDIESRELGIMKRANELDARDMLVNADVPKSHYEDFINLLVTEDSENTLKNVENFINMFNNTKSEIESNVRKELTKVPSPRGDSVKSDELTKEKFDSMGYIEKRELKETNPELFEQFIK